MATVQGGAFYKLDTKKLKNGYHTILVKTYDLNGTVTETRSHITVRNLHWWQRAMYWAWNSIHDLTLNIYYFFIK